MSAKPRLIDRQCAACEIQFQARAADVRRGLGRACSPRCSGRLGGRPKASHPVQEVVAAQEAHE